MVAGGNPAGRTGRRSSDRSPGDREPNEKKWEKKKKKRGVSIKSSTTCVVACT